MIGKDFLIIFLQNDNFVNSAEFTVVSFVQFFAHSFGSVPAKTHLIIIMPVDLLYSLPFFLKFACLNFSTLYAEKLLYFCFWRARTTIQKDDDFSITGHVGFGSRMPKSMGLKDKLSTMSEEEQLKMLATDGMLVKRPLLIGEDFVLVGFKEKEWSEKL